MLDVFTQGYWDRRYGESERVWSGRPNPQLVAHASALAPGTAVDVGCGEGADVVWLAQRGWTVTGADVSPVGLARAARHAEQAGVAEQVMWHAFDLFDPAAEPLGTYDLVNSQYLHLVPEVRERALARLAAAVAPGGHMLLVSHHPLDLRIPGLRPNMPELFYTAQELAAGLDPAAWEVLVADAPGRETGDREGRPVTVHDTVLLARRR